MLVFLRYAQLLLQSSSKAHGSDKPQSKSTSPKELALRSKRAAVRSLPKQCTESCQLRAVPVRRQLKHSYRHHVLRLLLWLLLLKFYPPMRLHQSKRCRRKPRQSKSKQPKLHQSLKSYPFTKLLMTTMSWMRC